MIKNDRWFYSNWNKGKIDIFDKIKLIPTKSY